MNPCLRARRPPRGAGWGRVRGWDWRGGGGLNLKSAHQRTYRHPAKGALIQALSMNVWPGLRRVIGSGHSTRDEDESALFATSPLLSVRAYPRPAAILACVLLPSVCTYPRPATLLAVVLLPSVRAFPRPAAIRASILPPAVWAYRRPTYEERSRPTVSAPKRFAQARISFSKLNS